MVLDLLLDVILELLDLVLDLVLDVFPIRFLPFINVNLLLLLLLFKKCNMSDALLDFLELENNSFKGLFLDFLMLLVTECLNEV